MPKESIVSSCQSRVLKHYFRRNRPSTLNLRSARRISLEMVSLD